METTGYDEEVRDPDPIAKATGSRFLTREQILAQRDHLVTRDIPVPEWGGDVRLRELTSRERTSVEMSLMTQKQGKNGMVQAGVNYDAYAILRAKVLSLSIVDEGNQRIFQPADIDALTELGSGPVERLFEVARALSGLSQQDVDSLVGNSVSTPNGGSHSV